ncbi:hypothetical protein BCR44DRAFT_1442164 [Catenaria anguillulae PL171]|uniref:Uncharacterized protein n=1 Tax=Catenaria anguillulae PL171 TaxID=765915 RepID=A0A1Y2HAB0_9FUNG|nr:hypothetical protein BCR44DRAFT_1442164 [Catenaria anguillulae PL171]
MCLRKSPGWDERSMDSDTSRGCSRPSWRAWPMAETVAASNIVLVLTMDSFSMFLRRAKEVGIDCGMVEALTVRSGGRMGRDLRMTGANVLTPPAACGELGERITLADGDTSTDSGKCICEDRRRLPAWPTTFGDDDPLRLLPLLLSPWSSDSESDELSAMGPPW